LPLGGRVKVDPWNDQLRMMKSKAVGTVAEAENTPFQITPFMFYLTRVVDSTPAPLAAGAGNESASKLETPAKPQVARDAMPGLPTPDPRKP